MDRSGRFGRLLGILATVIRRPGLTPDQLAAEASISERTLYRDLAQLRRLGYSISYQDGYQLQEALGLFGGRGPAGLEAVYAHQLRLLREEVPPGLAAQVEADLEAEAPAALALLIASTLKRRLNSGR